MWERLQMGSTPYLGGRFSLVFQLWYFNTICTPDGLEGPSTHQCTIQNIPFWDFMDGMKLSPKSQFTWSLVFFILEPFFFSCFFSFFFFVLIVFSPRPHFCFFFPSRIPWTQIIFRNSNLPTSLPSPNPSTSSILPTPHLCSPPLPKLETG